MNEKILNMHELIIELGGYESLANDIENFNQTVTDLAFSVHEHTAPGYEETSLIYSGDFSLSLYYLRIVAQGLRKFNPKDGTERSLVENTYTNYWGAPENCMMDVFYKCSGPDHFNDVINAMYYDLVLMLGYYAENIQYFKTKTVFDSHFYNSMINIRELTKGVKKFQVGQGGSAKLVEESIIELTNEALLNERN
jgi:hypothetical protein